MSNPFGRPPLEKWNALLESLGSPGGNLFVLVVLTFGLLFLVLHVLHHPEESAQVVTVIVSTFTGFTSAILVLLTGRRSGGPPSAPPPAAT